MQNFNRLNTTVFVLLFTLTSVFFVQCNQKQEDNSQALLKQALSQKDYATAAFAYNLILLKDSNNLAIKDSLARIYIRSGNFEGGLKLAEQVIAKHPDNNKLLELISLANGQLKKTDAAIDNLNALYSSTKDYIYLYKISGVYFDNDEFEKADSVCDMLIATADSTKKVEINLPNGQSQQVFILAACYNMKGAILTEMAELQQNGELLGKSIPFFQKAIKIDPEFAYPRLYLEKIAEFMQGGR